jgi:hypothetical protein
MAFPNAQNLAGGAIPVWLAPSPAGTLTGTVIGYVASDNVIITPDSYPQTLAYTGTNLTSITVVAPNGNTYVQTLTWTSGNLTGISKWVKQ